MSAPVVNGRRMAWVRDRLPEGGLPHHMKAARVLGSDPVPASSSNGDLAPVVYDQGQLGACVGHGVNEAEKAFAIRQGNAAAKMGARLWTYYLGRLCDNDIANDDGCQIFNAMKSVCRYGMPAEDVWPYSDASGPGAPFAQTPPPEAWRLAIDAGLSAHRIDSTGAALVDDIKRALGQRRVVVFGADVSEQFCQGAFDPTVPLAPPVGLALAGGHCQIVLDHKGDVFRVRNSWGPDWQDAGSSHWSADYLASSFASDFWIFDSASADLEGAGS